MKSGALLRVPWTTLAVDAQRQERIPASIRLNVNNVFEALLKRQLVFRLAFLLFNVLYTRTHLNNGKKVFC